MVGNRLASMDFPEPGGPRSRTLWAPAAATSRARFTAACPRTSRKSGPQGSARSAISKGFGGRGSGAGAPRKRFAASRRVLTG